jgi:hypothetical protein
MKRTAQIALATALLIGGATLATAQGGPPTSGYLPARWKPNLYSNHYDYYGPPCYGRFYNLAPYYYPGSYPGVPAYRYWPCWGYYPGAYRYWAYWGWR